MFGSSFFGAAQFGPSYFGKGPGTPTPPATPPARATFSSRGRVLGPDPARSTGKGA